MLGVPEPCICHTPPVVQNPRPAKQGINLAGHGFQRLPVRVVEDGESERLSIWPQHLYDPCGRNNFTGRTAPGHSLEFIEIIANRHGKSQKSLERLARRREGD
jgi:hypothetical protein